MMEVMQARLYFLVVRVFFIDLYKGSSVFSTAPGFHECAPCRLGDFLV